MTTTVPSVPAQPATPGQALRWAADRLAPHQPGESAKFTFVETKLRQPRGAVGFVTAQRFEPAPVSQGAYSGRQRPRVTGEVSDVQPLA